MLVETERTNRGVLNLRVGDIVEVRSAGEILATLDDNGALDSLPFMPEMLQHCGKRFRVFKRADKTCDTIAKTGLRRLHNTVHLENLRCGGEAHGGCEAGCILFWKEAWLRKVDSTFVKGTDLAANSGRTAPAKIGIDRLYQVAASPAANADEIVYSCQTTRLRDFSEPMAQWGLGQFWRDLRAGNVGVWTMVRAFALEAVNWVQKLRKGAIVPHIQGKLTKTPAEALNLQPGELVQVKSKDEIMATLDVNESNRGLSFDREMLPFCGGTYRVLRRVEKIVNERTGRMLRMNRDCIVLEGVACKALYHKFCPRSIYPYWREIWLRRAAPGAVSAECDGSSCEQGAVAQK